MKTEKSKITKKQVFFLVLILLISISIFAIVLSNRQKIVAPKENIEINQQILTGENNIVPIPEIKSNTIGVSSKLEDFYGKPSLIVFAGTYCGHCVKMVPELEKEIWNRYRLEANIWINVIDGSTGKKFNVKEIAQGYNPNLEYDKIMGDCSYVPAYVVLDKEGNQILRSCGSEKTIAEVKAAIDSQLQFK
jgi:thiol-disulfide isomerase/thioredoxin